MVALEAQARGAGNTMEALMMWVWPILIGAGFFWVSSRCRGRNAKAAFNFAAWGMWLFLLTKLGLHWIFPLSLLLYVPTILCFWLAATSILKEMRAQQRGEFTDAA
ncbi:MAG TPA: hypothetical protein VGS41_18655 [Chthonomonadales bacterium]|nr:hypothetical protein [Chthonomonadales bacterium]